MKHLCSKVALAMLLGLSAPALAQASDGDGCSKKTLFGDYAFSVHGEFLGLVTGSGPQYFPARVPIDAVAITRFDGRGGFTQADFTMVAGLQPPASPSDVDPHTGFTTNESGIYEVYPDCTGELRVNLPGVTARAKFVLADQGREIHSVVYQEHVASPILGCAVADGCDTLIQSRIDGKKLGR
jgi:hypothetical protein